LQTRFLQEEGALLSCELEELMKEEALFSERVMQAAIALSIAVNIGIRF